MKKLTIIITIILSVQIIQKNYSQPRINPNGERDSIRVTFNNPFTDEQIEITASLVGDRVVIGGDMVLGHRDEFTNTGRGGAAIRDHRKRWNFGVIPYTIDTDHPYQSEIEDALQQLNDQTNLIIIPKEEGEEDWVNFTHVTSGNDSGCWSELGMQGGEQQLNIDDGCQSLGTIMHEMLHATGFLHEQERRDRGEYISIKWNNIHEDWHDQFNKYNFGSALALGPYDYESVMHYPGTTTDADCAIDITQPIIETIDRSKQGLLGTESLSASDIRQINRIYRDDGITSDYIDPSTFRGPGRGGSEDESETSWPNEGGSSFDIRYEVELVPQLTGFSCWAAGAAMIVGWRDQVCINPSEIAEGTGYWAQYQQGLDANDTGMFEYWGLEYEAPQTYTPQGLVDLIGSYGPLWVATDEGAPHIRVIAGISGDGTPTGTILTIYDPWQRGMRRYRSNNTGSIYTETFQEFERKQHELAGKEMNEPAPYYVAHN